MNPRTPTVGALVLALLVPAACSLIEPDDPLAIAGHTFDLERFRGSPGVDHNLPHLHEPEHFYGCWTDAAGDWSGAAEDSRLDAMRMVFRNSREYRLTLTGATRCRTEDGVLSDWSDFLIEGDGQYHQDGDKLNFLTDDRRKLVTYVLLTYAGTRFDLPWVGWSVDPSGRGHTIYMPAVFMRR